MLLPNGLKDRSNDKAKPGALVEVFMDDFKLDNKISFSVGLSLRISPHLLY